MADPTTELAKEFLEMNNYLVRKETKFYKNKELKCTASDIDIIATRPKGIRIGDLKLQKNIIGEVKSGEVTKRRQFDEIYEDKFKFIDDEPEISWEQLKEHISGRAFDKALFCLTTTKDVYDYAQEEYETKIITTGFIIKNMADFFKNSEKSWSYYPEWHNYNILKSIMYYLYSSYKWKDRLTLEDLVWIDPEAEPRYRNQFVDVNSKFLEGIIYNQTSGKAFVNLINRLAKEDPGWFKKKLKSNKKFWVYLTK